MTRVVLNVCGIKSKGGITVLNNFLKNNSNLDLYIIYDNLDLENHVSRYKNQFIRVPRFCHPFLNFFINKNLKETINSYENIIHFGNLAFKTKIYSYTFIQNILPLVEPTSSLRNFLPVTNFQNLYPSLIMMFFNFLSLKTLFPKKEILPILALLPNSILYSKAFEYINH